MRLPLQQMSVQEYADLERRFGARVVEHNGQFWRQVRRFFYRPLLAWEALDGSVAPHFKWPTGYQYVVGKGAPANSTLSFVIFDNLPTYSLETAGAKQRNIVKRAARQFQIRPIQTAEALKEGYAAYVSFYQRTRYQHRSDRLNQPVFEQWAETLSRQPKAVVLGGYSGAKLVGMSCAYWVNSTLVHATLFCETEAMRNYVGELLFHELRCLAGQEPGIREIFARSYQNGSSHDLYYLHRGGKVVTKPSRFELPFPVAFGLRHFLPQHYAKLIGNPVADHSPESRVVASAAASPTRTVSASPKPVSPT